MNRFLLTGTPWAWLCLGLGLLTVMRAQAREPDLVAESVTVSDRSVDPGQLVTVRWTARNKGDKGSGATQQAVKWSTNATIDRGDLTLVKEYLGPLAAPGTISVFPTSSPETKNLVKIPDDAQIGGTYYIGVYADIDSDEAESNENNNGSNAVSVTINDYRPDFTVSGATVNGESGAINVEPGQNMEVSWTAKNIGADGGSSKQAVMWSTDATIDRNDTRLGDRNTLASIDAGESRSQTEFARVPGDALVGATYYVGVYMDFDLEHAERSESNNASNAVAVTVASDDKQDLIVEDLRIEGDDGLVTTVEAWPGQSVDLRWTARNRGTQFSLGTAQGIVWSPDSNVTTADRHLENEALGPLGKAGSVASPISAADYSREDHRIAVPEDAVIGRTYYVAVFADVNGTSNESNESNNRSNVISVKVSLPSSYSSLDVSDYNDLPYLDLDDPRLQDPNNDGAPNAGATMNRSRCFSPGDRAYIHAVIAHDSRFLTIGNATIPTRLRAYYNDRVSDEGLVSIPGEAKRNVGDDETRLNLAWTLPETPGSYYVKVVIEVDFHENGQWEELASEWIDGGNSADAITVTDDYPVILVHGWSDKDGVTFKNLEMMIESQLKRPVRFFQYETATLAAFGGDAPRAAKSFTEDGISKPSLSDQLSTFLASEEIDCADVIAHSMGGLVSRQNALSPNTRIRRLITLGTPNYGGNFSDGLDLGLNNQAEDLEYGNETAWNLYHQWKRQGRAMPEVLAVVGTNDTNGGRYNPSDGLVRCSSASLENLGYPVYYVPKAHTQFPTRPETDGMARVDDITHESWEPIRRFLSGENAPFPGAPGNLNGVDDVGNSGHPEALTAGLVYMVAQNGSPNQLVHVLESDVEWSPDIADLRQEDTSEIGIYYFVGRRADAQLSGSEYFSVYSVTADPWGVPAETRTVTVKAGQATVLES